MDALGIERAHVSATRWAAAWRSRSGCASPERVGGLALLCPARGVRAARLAPARAAAAPGARAAPPLARPRPDRAPVLVDVRRPRPGRPERGRHRRRRVRAHLPLRGRAARLPRQRRATIYLDQPFGRGGFYPRLAALEPPAMFVWGSHDKLIPPGFQPPRRALAARAPSRSCSRAAATCPQVERPERTNGLLDALLRAHRRARRRGRRLERRERADLDQRPRLAQTPRGHAARPTRGRAEVRPAACSAGARRVKGSSPAGSRPPTSTSATPTTSARASRGCGCSPRCTSAARCAGSATCPRRARVLLVGNHSGGNLTPDTIVFTLAFSTYFGVERRLLPARPQPRALDARAVASCASTARSPPRRRTPARRCEAGAAVLVYPGGDYEVHRPELGAPPGRLRRPQGLHPARARAGRADRAGRRRSAARRPRCSSRAASGSPRACGLDRLFRLKVLPISLALPWGLNVGDMLGHIPLPAKITVEALPPIHLREEFGAEPDLDEVYDHVVRADAGDARRARRRAPLPGDRMRVAESKSRSARRPRWCGSTSPTPRATCTSCPASRAGRSWASKRDRPRRALPDAAAGRLGRGRRPDRGRRVRARRATSPGRRSPASTSAAAGGCASADDGRTRVELRLAYGVAGSGICGWLAERVAAPTVRGHLRRTLQQLKRQVEHEQLRAAAAERRRSRMGAA